jgi:hypothetical protein
VTNKRVRVTFVPALDRGHSAAFRLWLGRAVTEGNIFPAGTIKGDGSTFDPNSGGALGRWYCRGTHLVSAAEFATSPRAVHTAQLYLLPSERSSTATGGVEGSVPVVRPITGGTGPFKGYIGEQRQRMLGFNATGGVNLRVTFVLRRVD